MKEQKKSQLKYYQMVLYTIENLLPIKDTLKTLPSSGINNCIKIQQRQRSRKTTVKELGKMESDKKILKTAPPVLYLQNPVFGIKVITNNKKLCIKINVKTM